MSEAAHQIVFREAHTMAVHMTVPVSCDGLNTVNFSPMGATPSPTSILR